MLFFCHLGTWNDAKSGNFLFPKVRVHTKVFFNIFILALPSGHQQRGRIRYKQEIFNFLYAIAAFSRPTLNVNIIIPYQNAANTLSGLCIQYKLTHIRAQRKRAYYGL